VYCPKCDAANSDQAAFCAHCGVSLRDNDGIPLRPVFYVGTYAGFWRRFAAWSLDGIVIAAIALAAFIASRDVLASALFGGWLYCALMESSPMHATLGKMALGLVVTNMEGEGISFRRATGRYFGKVAFGLVIGIGCLAIVFNRKKQGMHDELADTLVLKK